jgi:hypothetical protein
MEREPTKSFNPDIPVSQEQLILKLLAAGRPSGEFTKDEKDAFMEVLKGLAETGTLSLEDQRGIGKLMNLLDQLEDANRARCLDSLERLRLAKRESIEEKTDNERE